MFNVTSKLAIEYKMAACPSDSVNNPLTYAQCHDAILNSEFKFEIFFFYANVVFGVLRSVFEFFYGHYAATLLVIILYCLVYVTYKAFWNHTLYSKELTETGFDHIPEGPDRDRRIARAQLARRMGSKIPPPYPNGWFAVAETRDLKIGDVVSVDALGQNLCVYRGEDGVARCVDAYCPHLGANLAIGGTVCGSCIECPFHKWKFNADGACVSVPGVEHAPKGVSIKTWTTVEADGAVWIWYDAEGREPLWSMSDSPQMKTFGYRGRNEFIVSAHIQEIPENGADVAHLNAVHSPSLVSSLGEKFPMLYNLIGRHVWRAEWLKGEDHTAVMNLVHDYKVLKFDLAHTEVKVIQNGPGQVKLLVDTAVGQIYVMQSVTPLGPLLQKVVHRMYSPVYNAPVASFFVKYEGVMFERDVKIWNSKRFVSAPAYVRSDKAIRSFRSWFAQFYSENSVSFRNALQNPLDW
ncbi:hypothetical protein O3G_MSEX012668 [Manduca sexta]|uniref:cholesterol 7-desaturase n=1 Tax=Manduca sexta TaxID=7130 RepID=A0A921ZQC8_MANSE|nr:hypothetical protein O3G_MSEX012668 [Manduca sexta]KAG6461501.1 hypothetical protein O3G_MSEX012668 [Manduca sexta]